MTKPAGRPVRKPAIPNGVMGMSFFIAAEVMLFAAFISSYMILRAGVPVWPPWGQPRLPILTTGFNSMVLLSSAVLLHFAKVAFKAQDMAKMRKLYLGALGAGLFFVIFQGYEWFQLIQFGLTLTSSTYGGIFYVTIGAHAVHAVTAIFALALVLPRLSKLEFGSAKDEFTAIQLFWYFVVGLWPVLYVTIYLY